LNAGLAPVLNQTSRHGANQAAFFMCDIFGSSCCEIDPFQEWLELGQPGIGSDQYLCAFCE
jgi:hypothetical protein